MMNKLKILVVDDESRMRKLVRDFLVKQNFEVVEAGGYRTYHTGCYDAKDEWMGSVQGDPGNFKSTDHHADREER